MENHEKVNCIALKRFAVSDFTFASMHGENLPSDNLPKKMSDLYGLHNNKTRQT